MIGDSNWIKRPEPHALRAARHRVPPVNPPVNPPVKPGEKEEGRLARLTDAEARRLLELDRKRKLVAVFNGWTPPAPMK